MGEFARIPAPPGTLCLVCEQPVTGFDVDSPDWVPLIQGVPAEHAGYKPMDRIVAVLPCRHGEGAVLLSEGFTMEDARRAFSTQRES